METREQPCPRNWTPSWIRCSTGGWSCWGAVVPALQRVLLPFRVDVLSVFLLSSPAGGCSPFSWPIREKQAMLSFSKLHHIYLSSIIWPCVNGPSACVSRHSWWEHVYCQMPGGLMSWDNHWLLKCMWHPWYSSSPTEHTELEGLVGGAIATAIFISVLFIVFRRKRAGKRLSTEPLP